MPGIKRKSVKSAPAESSKSSKKIKVDKPSTKRAAKPDPEDISEEEDATSEAEDSSDNDSEAQIRGQKRKGTDEEPKEKSKKVKDSNGESNEQKTSALASLNGMKHQSRCFLL
jgi:pumilio family protein 6